MSFADEPVPSPSTTINNANGSVGSSGAGIQSSPDGTSSDDGLEGWAIFLIILLHRFKGKAIEYFEEHTEL